MPRSSDPLSLDIAPTRAPAKMDRRQARALAQAVWGELAHVDRCSGVYRVGVRLTKWSHDMWDVKGLSVLSWEDAISLALRLEGR